MFDILVNHDLCSQDEYRPEHHTHRLNLRTVIVDRA